MPSPQPSTPGAPGAPVDAPTLATLLEYLRSLARRTQEGEFRWSMNPHQPDAPEPPQAPGRSQASPSYVSPEIAGMARALPIAPALQQSLAGMDTGGDSGYAALGPSLPESFFAPQAPRSDLLATLLRGVPAPSQPRQE
jgi:hypothetical protein